MSVSLDRTTLAVIAGGAGSRMGGPKHSLRICGRPILVDLLERVRWTGPTLLSLEHAPLGDVAGQDRFTLVVRDGHVAEGPLAAIRDALAACGTDALLAIPVDMCGLEHEHLAWLAGESARTGATAVYLRRSASPDGIEPLPLYVRREALEGIEQTLAAGRRSIRAFLATPGVAALEVPSGWPESVWTNLNTPDDLIHAERARGYTP